LHSRRRRREEVKMHKFEGILFCRLESRRKEEVLVGVKSKTFFPYKGFELELEEREEVAIQLIIFPVV
jgi:hypothetical protein